MGERLEGEDLAAVLKDGTVLCRLMNCIKPNSVKRFRQTVGGRRREDCTRDILSKNVNSKLIRYIDVG